jgi:ATP-binding cassette subfamily B protein
MIIPAVAIAGSSAERIFDILDAISEVQDRQDARPLGVIQGRVCFDHVSFSYGKRKVLRDIHFEIQPGQTVALLGSTGSGKSSIIQLIPRFYDPSAGSILIDGIDIREVSLQSLRSQIGIVLQETTLFATTIREDIAFGATDASDEEIIRVAQAARQANVHDFISKLPDGYQTRVLEGGANISQGQRQLISIARALLTHPRILILDEATANIDTVTEALIQEALARLFQGRTAIVIAHRLSTVRNADFVYVLNHGQIVEQGVHADLLAGKGLYFDLYERQFMDE